MRKKTQSCGLVVSACNPDMLSCGACVGNAGSNRTFVKYKNRQKINKIGVDFYICDFAGKKNF